MKKEMIPVDQLNKELALWICDVDFWMDEVIDCQKLLDDNFPSVDETNESKQLEQFQNQIIYYRYELLPELKRDLLIQKGTLKKHVDPDTIIKNQEELAIRVAAIEEQMKARRTLINQFIQQL